MKTATVIKEKLLSNLFLGTGGAKPGVSILANDCGYEKGLPHHLLDSSVYAGDIDIERCRIGLFKEKMAICDLYFTGHRV